MTERKPVCVKLLELDRRRWVVLPERDYLRLLDQARLAAEPGWPMLPAMDTREHYDAVKYARVSLARKILRGRRLAGLSQVELARRAGIRPETLNRLERGKTTPAVATIAKLERALESAPPEAEVVRKERRGGATTGSSRGTRGR